MLIGIQWKGYSQALVSVDGQSVGAPCNPMADRAMLTGGQPPSFWCFPWHRPASAPLSGRLQTGAGSDKISPVLDNLLTFGLRFQCVFQKQTS